MDVYVTRSNPDELMHYGVKGMKWGHRRAEKRIARADKQIRRLNTLRDNNKNVYKTMQQESREMYTGKKAKKLNKALAGDKAIYDTSEVNNRYAIARQNAKKDKAYKNSNEYKSAKAAFNKQQTQVLLYGAMGHQRIETLKNMGYSEKKAKGKTFAEQALLGVAAGAAIAGTSYLVNRR